MNYWIAAYLKKPLRVHERPGDPPLFRIPPDLIISRLWPN